jgi:hypothetical protein
MKPTVEKNPADIPTENPCQARLVLVTTRKMGWFKSKICYLVFQEDELLLVHLSKRNYNQAVVEYRAEQKAQGKGFFATTWAMANFWRNYGNRYYLVNRDALVALDPDNLALPYASISRFIFKTARATTSHSPDGSYQNISGKLLIDCPSGKLKFSHDYFDYNKKIKGILNGLIGKQLSYRAPMLQKQIKIGGDPNEIS